MTLEQFRMLAADARANSVLRHFAVAAFTGRGLTISVDVDLEEASDEEIRAALLLAADMTGRTV